MSVATFAARLGHVLALAFACLVLLAAGLAAWLRWGPADGVERTDFAYVRGHVSQVAPRVAGRVLEVLVDDGDRVAAGQAVVRLESEERLAEHDRAAALVERRRAALAALDARLAAQRAEIAVADARSTTAAAELARTANDLTRSRQLVREGWTARQIHEDNEARLAIAEAALGEARARAQAERRRLDALASERAALAADLAEAEAMLRRADIALADTLVVAPIAGVVANRTVAPGEYVREGTGLLAVVPTDGLWVEANFKETEIRAMRAGQPAALWVDSLPGPALCGRVASLGAASRAEFALIPPDSAVGNFTKIVRRLPVRIALAPGAAPPGPLRPGLSVVVAVRTGPSRGRWSARLAERIGLRPASPCLEAPG